MLNSSAQKNMKQFFVTFAMVGLVTHGQIQPGFFIHDTLVMGKCIKTGFSVVASHTAFSHTAEAHFGSGKVNNGIIDAAASIGNFSQHSSDMGLIMTEQIQGKRLCLGLQGKYHVVKIFICQHRQDGTEDFFLHDGIFESHVIQNGRSNALRSRIRITAAHYFGGVYQSAKSLKMLFVDDFSVVWIGKRIFSILFFNLFYEFAKKFVLDFFVTENVIRSTQV